jgi:hypothetical protein
MDVSWHIATLFAQAVVVAAIVAATSTPTVTSKVVTLIIFWVGNQQLLQPC